MIWSMKCLMIRLFHACMHVFLWNQRCLETTHYFFKIWHKDTWSEFFLKILIGTEFRGTFCFAQKLAGWAKNSGFFFFLIFGFVSKSKMKHCHLYFTAKPLPVESLVYKLCVKMLLANQVAGFFNISRKKWKTKQIFCM